MAVSYGDAPARASPKNEAYVPKRIIRLASVAIFANRGEPLFPQFLRRFGRVSSDDSGRKVERYLPADAPLSRNCE